MTLIECQRLKAQVVQEIRANQQLEQDLNIMDIKIGLLVKNRITLQVGVVAVLPYKEVGKVDINAYILQDVVSQSARLKKTGAQEIGARLGTLSKANRETVEVILLLMISILFASLFVVIKSYHSIV